MAHPTAVAIRLTKAIEAIQTDIVKIKAALGIDQPTEGEVSDTNPNPLPPPKQTAEALTRKR